jgi:hypothetical protein
MTAILTSLGSEVTATLGVVVVVGGEAVVGSDVPPVAAFSSFLGTLYIWSE